MTLPRLDIPEQVNVYLSLQTLHTEDATRLLAALHQVFSDYEIQPKDFNVVGNAVLRLALWLTLKPSFTTNDPHLQILLLMCSDLLTLVDDQSLQFLLPANS